MWVEKGGFGWRKGGGWGGGEGRDSGRIGEPFFFELIKESQFLGFSEGCELEGPQQKHKQVGGFLKKGASPQNWLGHGLGLSLMVCLSELV